MSTPTVSFTDERLANGLRLIIAEDHLAPVVAINLWYNVGSKHEVSRARPASPTCSSTSCSRAPGTSRRPSTSPSSRPPAGR